MTARTRPDQVREKIEARLDKSTEHWLWTGSLDTNGYGLIRVSGSLMKVHRAYLIALGQEIDGLEVDHLCRVKACVNPDHLEAVTHQENVLRGVGPTANNAAKTHCINGHEFTPDNTMTVKTRPGNRHCRECNRIRVREWRANR